MTPDVLIIGSGMGGATLAAALAPSGKRIVSAELLEANGAAHAIEPATRYRVALIDYLERKGDGYAMLAKGAPVEAPDAADVDVLAAYSMIIIHLFKNHYIFTTS